MTAWLQQRLVAFGGRITALAVWLMCLALVWMTDLHDKAREYAFDQLQVWHWHLSPRDDDLSPRVWIIAIDDPSITKANNVWPYPRHQLSDLVERAALSGVSAIGLDIFLPNRSTDAAADDWLDVTLRNTSNLVLGHPLADPRFGTAPLPDLLSLKSGASVAGSFGDNLIASQSSLVPSHGQIDRHAAGHGFINDDWVDDTRLRRIPLLVAHGQSIYPAFAAELARIGLGHAQYNGLLNNGLLEAVDIVGPELRSRVKVDDRSIMRPRFKPMDKLRLISAHRVHDNGEELPFHSADMVIIGASALGVGDTGWTAFGEMPGVEIHAQILESILAEDAWWRPPFIAEIEFVIAVALMLMMLTLAPRMTGLGALALVGGLAIGVLIMVLMVMEYTGILVDPLAPVGSAMLIFLTLHAMRIVVERQRRRVAENDRLALETEMEVARDIQNSIMVRPDRIDGLPNSIKVEAELVQSNFVGGDFFDVFMIDEERLFVIVADVSGKGWSGAFFMAIVKAFIQSFALAAAGGPADIVARAEREIMRSNPNELFVTAIVGILNTRTGELELCNAGHPPPVLIAEGQSSYSLTTKDAPPIAMVPGFVFESSHHQLRNGETLLFFTDGLADLSDSANGDSMGDLRQFLDKQRDGRAGILPAATIVERARKEAQTAEDDITLLTLRYA